MSYFNDEDIDLEYLKHHTRKEKDIYLLETVKLLNDGCTHAVKYEDPKKQKTDGAKVHRWDIDDIDYDFEECRKYCLYIEDWDVCPAQRLLCKSCDLIINNRILEPFTKSKSELIYDSILLQKQMTHILERLAKLEAI